MTTPVHPPDWREITLHPGVLREADPENNRLVVWLLAEADDRCQYWHRVSSVPRATIARDRDLCTVAATAIRARQPVRRLFGRLLRRFRSTRDGSWLLPNGETAEQCGERETDLLLVWAEDHNEPLDETRVQENWPQSARAQMLGPNLCLVWGVAAPAADGGARASASEECSPEHAAQRLTDARREGDRAKEASALADLGLLALEDGDAAGAVAHLEKAMALARALKDQPREGDILFDMARVMIRASQPEPARQYLEQALVLIRVAGDRYAEKLTLELLAKTHAMRGDRPAALGPLAEALALARTLGDRQHEAKLLWHTAVRQADLERREQAIGNAQAAVQLMENLGMPQARVYADVLRQYRTGKAEAAWPDSSVEMAGGGMGTTVLVSQPQAGPEPRRERAEAGYVQMGLSAAKALAKFLGSGMKTVNAETLEERLQGCAGCDYYTGLRCRVCGCFAKLKARLPHEECPLGRWPTLTFPDVKSD